MFSRLNQARVLAGLAIAVLVLIFVFFGFVLYEADRREQARVETRLFICNEIEDLKREQRLSLAEEISDARAFLEENPEGIPGIPPEEIERSIRRKEVRIARLRPVELGCESFARQASLPTPLSILR